MIFAPYFAVKLRISDAFERNADEVIIPWRIYTVGSSSGWCKSGEDEE